jgi:hypothetical protein
VRELPITTWNYTSDTPSIRHIGPMTQDFSALFGVGADDLHIHPLDGQGWPWRPFKRWRARLTGCETRTPAWR